MLRCWSGSSLKDSVVEFLSCTRQKKAKCVLKTRRKKLFSGWKLGSWENRCEKPHPNCPICCAYKFPHVWNSKNPFRTEWCSSLVCHIPTWSKSTQTNTSHFWDVVERAGPISTCVLVQYNSLAAHTKKICLARRMQCRKRRVQDCRVSPTSRFLRRAQFVWIRWWSVHLKADRVKQIHSRGLEACGNNKVPVSGMTVSFELFAFCHRFSLTEHALKTWTQYAKVPPAAADSSPSQEKRSSKNNDLFSHPTLPQLDFTDPNLPLFFVLGQVHKSGNAQWHSRSGLVEWLLCCRTWSNCSVLLCASSPTTWWESHHRVKTPNLKTLRLHKRRQRITSFFWKCLSGSVFVLSLRLPTWVTFNWTFLLDWGGAINLAEFVLSLVDDKGCYFFLFLFCSQHTHKRRCLTNRGITAVQSLLLQHEVCENERKRTLKQMKVRLCPSAKSPGCSKTDWDSWDGLPQTSYSERIVSTTQKNASFCGFAVCVHVCAHIFGARWQKHFVTNLNSQRFFACWIVVQNKN